MGEVVNLRVAERTCDSCLHVMYGRSGIYCSLFREDVLDGAVAVECDGYDPD